MAPIARKMTTIWWSNGLRIYTHEDCLQHEVAPGHPENTERLTSLITQIKSSELAEHLLSAPSVEAKDVLAAHASSHLSFLESMLPEQDVVAVDADTWMGPHSMSAALHAAGAVCAGVRDVMSNTSNRVFCAVRPPGHHAERNNAMGFCLFNSIAIGAHHALQNEHVERVAILDFDVHHGNGTVDIFADCPEVLVCSSFQHPHYPNRKHDIKRPNIVYSPLDAGTTGPQFRKIIEQHWLPALASHQPDLLLVSAGFDAHQLDPLADINLLEDDFTWITELIVDAAETYCSGRVVSTLEGGYDLESLKSSTMAHLRALA